jgi:hypothetical protein
MGMGTNLRGRLRNTSLPYGRGLLPLFDGVINSIQSIEEAGLSSNGGRITVEIVRKAKTGQFEFEGEQKKRGPDACEDIVGFKVTDNGIGFNDANLESFKTLDSEYKAGKGCRGIGRLLWLKAFEQVIVDSTYRDEADALRSRTFVFNAASGVTKEKTLTAQDDAPRATCVHLVGFDKRYREASNKTARAIANSLFEHCLWYFVRKGGAPKIMVRDVDESIDLDEVYERHMVSSAVSQTIVIKKSPFELTHVKLRANSSQAHVIALCAANRLVQEENIAGKIPGLYGKLRDSNGEFVYACYVSSPFLDAHARSERTGFDIVENGDKLGPLYANTEISLTEIREAVVDKASAHLSAYLEENKKKARDRVENFIAQKAPRYRPILKRIPEDKLHCDPNISDKELDLALHKHLSELEGTLLADGHDVMSPRESEDSCQYQERLQEYLRAAQDIKQSDLANYVFHRKVILDLLKKAIERGEDGKYAREDLIHNLIMPMQKDSNDVMADICNLWLVDERLAFHDYLASDKTLASMPVTGNTDTKEPDLCALNVFDNPILVSEGNRLPLASIIVVEIKRPMRNDAAQGEEKDPIEQSLGYLDRIRQGGVRTARGRPIPNSSDIPGYCYVICDITPSIELRCKMHGYTVTSDKLGYFGYNPPYKAYVEVVSFQRLVNAANERNRAFFDKLGLPTT